MLAVFLGTIDCTSRRIEKGQPGVISENLASRLQSIHIRPHHREDLIDLGLWALVDGPQELLMLVLVHVSRGLLRRSRWERVSSIDLVSVSESALIVTRLSSLWVHWLVCAGLGSTCVEISSAQIDNYILTTAAARINGSQGPDRPQC